MSFINATQNGFFCENWPVLKKVIKIRVLWPNFFTMELSMKGLAITIIQHIT